MLHFTKIILEKKQMRMISLAEKFSGKRSNKISLESNTDKEFMQKYTQMSALRNMAHLVCNTSPTESLSLKLMLQLQLNCYTLNQVPLVYQLKMNK